MELFSWDEQYSVHIVKIDDQHKKLLLLINDLYKGLEAGQSRKELRQIFMGLLDYALNHFQAEEDLLAEHHFPGLLAHKKEHDEFRTKVSRFVDIFLDTNADVATDMVFYLIGWLRTHVFITDMEYSVFLNERGVH